MRQLSIGEVYALDLEKGLLSQAEVACVSCINFHSIAGDAHDLPLLIDGSVYFVFMANTFHGMSDKKALSEAVYKSLKPGGCFAIINWYRLPREVTTVLEQPRGPDTKLRMEPEEVPAHVELAGFKLEKVADVGPYHYAAVFTKFANSQV